MSVFLDTNHLFLRNPRGGVEDVGQMAAAGFKATFCNVGDFGPEEWQTVRDRARWAGVTCGPWLRTTDSSGIFKPDRLDELVMVADEWNAPFIVNSETELKGTDGDLTSYIAHTCGARDWALSTEPWPYANVDWQPIASAGVPVLPQIFGQRWAQDADGCRWQWQHVWGVRCVVFTFGAYSAWLPQMYNRLSPYGVFAADDCGNNFVPWRPMGQENPCADQLPPTNGGGDNMTKIGSQHGVTAAMNRQRDMDPGGTLLVKAGGKWPSISTLTQPVEDWKAYDKLERALTILVTDHDAAA